MIILRQFILDDTGLINARQVSFLQDFSEPLITYFSGCSQQHISL